MAKKQKKESLQDILDEIPERWVELVKDKVDGRTKEGIGFWKALRSYHRTKDTKKRGLVENLLVLFDGRIMDIVNAEPIWYQEHVKTRCACGEEIEREVYLMKIKGRAIKDGKESQIITKIKNQTSLSAEDLKAYGLFFLGSTCQGNFSDLISYYGQDMEEKVTESRKKKSEEMEDTNLEISAELREKLKDLHIDEEQFKLIQNYLKDASDLSEESSVLYELDLGKNRSFGNWFREKINSGEIKNEEIIEVYHRLKHAPKSLTTKDLAALTTYSYEYRRFDTNAVMGGIKDDLLYLSCLEYKNPLIKEFGRFNIDKDYVRPDTRFRERKDNPDIGKKIRDKLKEPDMSFLEAIGIMVQFPNVESARVRANRDVTARYIKRDEEIARKYGVGQEWDNVLRELRDVFEKENQELSEEYREFGEILKDHVLTRDEHITLKRFFKRSFIGSQRTQRENYLRMFSIKEFKEIAPEVIKIGRKLRYANRQYQETGSELLKLGLLRQKYILNEDLEDKFTKLTGIEENYEIVIDMLLNAQCVGNKAFRKFQEDDSKSFKEAYDNGLFASKNLNKLARNYERLQKEEVVELDDKTKERLAKIVKYSKSEFVNVKYEGKVEKNLEGIEVRDKTYVPKKFISVINRIYNSIDLVLDHTKLEERDLDNLRENKAKLKEKGNVLYVQEEDGKLKDSTYYSNMRVNAHSIRTSRFLQKGWRHRDIPKGDEGYKVSAVDAERIEEAVKNIESGVEVDEEFLKKFDSLNRRDLRAIGEKGFELPYNLRYSRNKFDRVIFSEGLKERIESIYEKVQNYQETPLAQAARRREEEWNKIKDSRERDVFSRKFREMIYDRIVKDDDELQKIIEGVAGGFLKYGSLSRNQNYDSKRRYRFDLTFSRFMGDGVNFMGDRLASGNQVEFKVHDRVYNNLEQDFKDKKLDAQQYEQGKQKLEKFEKDVNKLLLEYKQKT